MSEAVAIASLDDAESQDLAARIVAIAAAMSECDGVARFDETGWLPDRFFELLGDLYAAYDAYVAHNLTASGLAIRCRLGCARCCHQAVHGMFAFEVIALYRQLSSLPDYPALRSALVDYADQFQATLAQVSEADDGDPGEPMQRTLEAFAAAAAPCPLLAGSSCRVYAHRPLPCRMLHSLTDPLLCTTPEGSTFNIEVPPAAAAILWSLSDRLAYPFPTLLAQGLVTFGDARQHRPWARPRSEDTLQRPQPSSGVHT